jgi:hypothetical protein
VTYASEVLADTPLGYWRLDDASGTFTDSSGNSRYGLKTGIVTYSQPPATTTIGGTSCTFPGTAYAQSSASWLNALTALSVEGWVKFTSTAIITIMGRDGGSGSFRQLDFRANAGKIELVLWVSSATMLTLASPLTYNDGAWHHVVGTYVNAPSGNNMFVYVDGAQVNAMANPTNLTQSPSTDNFFLAARAVSLTPWVGSLDELAIYNTALSSARVAAHYAAAVPPTVTSFMGWGIPIK